MLHFDHGPNLDASLNFFLRFDTLRPMNGAILRYPDARQNRYRRALSVGVCGYLFLFFAFFSPSSGHCDAKETLSNTVAVIISRKVRPYLKVAEGIAKGADLAPDAVDQFIMDESGRRDILPETLKKGKYGMIVAVGPEAAGLVWQSGPPLVPRLYAAVLDPHAIGGMDTTACGISLRIPVQTQLKMIHQTFPAFKRIGLLFDPTYNAWFYESASVAAKGLGLEIVPIDVTARKKIPTALKAGIKHVDAVWMIPDQTIISEKIIHYVIRQGLYHNIGVIGYNSFFIRSGALFAFEFNYTHLGQQAGRKIKAYISTGICRSESPKFNTVVNGKIAAKLGVEVRQ